MGLLSDVDNYLKFFMKNATFEIRISFPVSVRSENDHFIGGIK